MITLGIDLSSMPKGTAACVISWELTRASVQPPRVACSDEILDDLISKADAVGVDAPFGWPRKFVSALNVWHIPKWDKEIRDELRFRFTDSFVHNQIGLLPLSVSSDKIALPAMRAMAMLQRNGITDKATNGKFFEVYPAASLKSWHLPAKGYKGKDENNKIVRQALFEKLCAKFPFLEFPPAYVANDDSLDSLVASLTARVAFQGRCLAPPPGQIEIVQLEGWINVPNAFPSI